MNLLFVCTGNICRSPMAEGIARRLAAEMGVPLTASSGGTLGLVDRPADPKAIKVCREIGVDLTAHRSQGVSAALVEAADVVFVMEPAHAAELAQRFPISDDKLWLMGPLVGQPEIPDPIGGWIWTFRRTRRQIERALTLWLTRHGPSHG